MRIKMVEQEKEKDLVLILTGGTRGNSRFKITSMR